MYYVKEKLIWVGSHCCMVVVVVGVVVDDVRKIFSNIVVVVYLASKTVYRKFA